MPVLVDADFDGAPRKLLLQASRNGYYFVLDRTTGKNLLTTPFATVNWAKGIDEDGRPIPDPDKEPARDGRLVAPDEAGGTNYRSPSFDPATGLLIVSAHDAYGIYFFKPEHGAYGWAGADYTVYGRGVLRAIDYQTGKIRWSHDLARRRRRRRRADDGDGPDVHRRLREQRARASHERRHDAVALGHRAASATRRSPTSSTAASTCWSAAEARCTHGRSPNSLRSASVRVDVSTVPGCPALPDPRDGDRLLARATRGQEPSECAGKVPGRV